MKHYRFTKAQEWNGSTHKAGTVVAVEDGKAGPEDAEEIDEAGKPVGLPGGAETDGIDAGADGAPHATGEQAQPGSPQRGASLTKAEEDELRELGGDPEALRAPGEKPPKK